VEEMAVVTGKAGHYLMDTQEGLILIGKK